MQTLHQCCKQRLPTSKLGLRAASLGSVGSRHLYHRDTVPCHLWSQTAGSVHQLTRRASNQAPSTAQTDEDSRRFQFRALKRDGGYETIHILPTPKANRKKLLSDLRHLNLGEKGYPHRWYFDSGGDAIHAVRIGAPSVVDFAIEEIQAAADAKRHHAHISRCDIADIPGFDHDLQVVTFTCTTHRPHGLGVRDTTLARRIDSILEYASFSERYEDPQDVQTESQVAKEIDNIFRLHVGEHRKAMAEARQ